MQVVREKLWVVSVAAPTLTKYLLSTIVMYNRQGGYVKTIKVKCHFDSLVETQYGEIITSSNARHGMYSIDEEGRIIGQISSKRYCSYLSVDRGMLYAFYNINEMKAKILIFVNRDGIWNIDSELPLRLSNVEDGFGN